MQLALDTSTATLSLALAEKGRVIAELSWPSGNEQTAELLPSLHWLLQKSGASLDDIDGLIVALGPGSFNSLRIGVSTIQGLAFARAIPVVGIGTLEVEAYPHAASSLPLCPLLDAGRGMIATALYRMEGEEWRCLLPAHMTSLEDLFARIKRPTLFCGSQVQALASSLKERLGKQAQIASPAASLRRAGFLAELGWLRLARGERDAPASLQPLYLRGPSITQKKQG